MAAHHRGLSLGLPGKNIGAELPFPSNARKWKGKWSHQSPNLSTMDRSHQASVHRIFSKKWSGRHAEHGAKRQPKREAPGSARSGEEAPISEGYVVQWAFWGTAAAAPSNTGETTEVEDVPVAAAGWLLQGIWIRQRQGRIKRAPQSHASCPDWNTVSKQKAADEQPTGCCHHLGAHARTLHPGPAGWPASSITNPATAQPASIEPDAITDSSLSQSFPFSPATQSSQHMVQASNFRARLLPASSPPPSFQRHSVVELFRLTVRLAVQASSFPGTILLEFTQQAPLFCLRTQLHICTGKESRPSWATQRSSSSVEDHASGFLPAS